MKGKILKKKILLKKNKRTAKNITKTLIENKCMKNDDKSLNNKRNSRALNSIKTENEKNKNENLLCSFDGLIFFGDLNYRLELPKLEVKITKYR